MKVTGYTIIYFLLSILLLWGFVEFEIWIYQETIIKNSDNFNFIFTNIMITFVIIITLGMAGYLNKLDKLLKKRIL